MGDVPKERAGESYVGRTLLSAACDLLLKALPLQPDDEDAKLESRQGEERIVVIGSMDGIEIVVA